MKASTPSKVGENAHKITKGVNLVNLGRGGGVLKVFMSMVGNKNVNVCGGRKG
jgi:hypothetical protein